MSSPDLPLRERVKRLQAHLDAALAAIYSIIGVPNNTAFDVPIATLRAGNYSVYEGVVISADDAGQPGLFVKTTSVPAGVNGTDFVIDSVGTIFKRLRLV